ncbi:MAG: tetraacyldisaccharide 4'-kinase [Muribaculaceae bacterium]|nr:tetraacyldisaccharide 4'-kinase [Muribaculaceae bacterium]
MAQKTLLSKLVLLPCSKVYGAVTFMRNKFFDWNILKEVEFEVPIITVGNLAVGGTGKTPLVEYIAGALKANYHIAVLSRGYKRETKGFVMAGKNTMPRDIGDESFQIYNKFNGEVTVAVCEDRVTGIRELMNTGKQIDIILLDDAFQHRYVKPLVSIVVSEYSHPIYADAMLPYGRLREPSRGINRADMLVVSKCPTELKPMDYRNESNRYALQAWQQLFFTHLDYRPLAPVFDDMATSVPYLDWLTENDSVLAVAGIGNPRPFVKYVKSHAARVKVDIYPDHHQYTRKDLEHLLERFNSLRGARRYIITTEKDAVRMAANPYFPHQLKASTFYLPVGVDFEYPFGGPDFTEALEKTIRERLRERAQQ